MSSNEATPTPLGDLETICGELVELNEELTDVIAEAGVITDSMLIKAGQVKTLVSTMENASAAIDGVIDMLSKAGVEILDTLNEADLTEEEEGMDKNVVPFLV
jgi:16S rRNA C1402 (ribose-2'-O) methylase RsmI